jgi:hypothetical protein
MVSSNPSSTAPKAEAVAALLERRIRNGDYLVARLPAERVLAAETGVSYMTARKAVTMLIERGLLARGDNGRLELGEALGRKAQAPAQIAFFAPAWPTLDIQHWRRAVEAAAAARGASVKAYYYMHWEDPVLAEALERGDGAFIYPLTGEVPARVRQALLAEGVRVVWIDYDPLGEGLPSITLSPPEAVAAVLDHLRQRGHRAIACLNTQPHDRSSLGRIDAWRDWCRVHGVAGDLLDQPVQPGEDPAPQALAVVARWLAAGRPAASALFVTTGMPAVAAMRAIHDAGLRPGPDLALATLNDEGDFGRYTIPGLTAIHRPDAVPLVARGVAWMTSGKAWSGALRIMPDSFAVIERESTTGA